jgi:hypothetical protein
MLGAGRDRGASTPPRRVSTTYARYFNMAWDGAASHRSISEPVSPLKTATIPSLQESMELPSLTNGRLNLPSMADAYPFTLFDRSPLDSEVSCSSWGASVASSTRSWLGSKLERKIRNPMACDSIGYDIRGYNSLRTFLVCIPLLTLWSCLFKVVGSFWHYGSSQSRQSSSGTGIVQSVREALGYAELVVTLFGGLLYSQGYHK